MGGQLQRLRRDGRDGLGLGLGLGRDGLGHGQGLEVCQLSACVRLDVLDP